MKDEAKTPEEYIENLPEDRKLIFSELRKVIRENLPEGFVEEMSYGMIGFVVPHSLFPEGYHVNPKLPLPFMNIASQKNFIALYHMGIYSKPELLDWFVKEYPKHMSTKLDMGKSCIRFKNVKKIPFDLIGELSGKMSVKEWVKLYKRAIS